MLDFRVYTFLAVCEYMNYTRAAEALHITQPAVSQHIRYLENMYQVKLFLAEGKKIHLSPAGERLLHAATTLKNDEVFLRKQMFEGAGKGLSLRFGTTRTIGESAISTAIPRTASALSSTTRTSFCTSWFPGRFSLPWLRDTTMTWILIPWFSGQSLSYLYVLPAMYLPGSRSS